MSQRIELSGIGQELVRADRNDGPLILWRWWESGGRRDVGGLRRVIAGVWMMAEWPTSALGVALWVEMFRAAGFVSDTGEPKPALPWTVYRGTVWGRRRGMSWTTDLERARWFAARYAVRHRAGLVFAVDVEPSAVLALVGDPGGRNESEVVVDLALLPTIGRRSVVSDS